MQPLRCHIGAMTSGFVATAAQSPAHCIGMARFEPGSLIRRAGLFRVFIDAPRRLPVHTHPK
jgi:hypothetical protein